MSNVVDATGQVLSLASPDKEEIVYGEVDLEAARQELVASGCKVLRWRGKGQDCYIEDPFGVIYNIWEG